MISIRWDLTVTAALAAVLAGPASLAGQEPPAPDSLDLAALVAEAREANPEIRAAAERVAAARARFEAAGVPPDPRLGIGLVNALVSDPLSTEDFMTMRMIQVGQVFPFPGKLSVERRAARWGLTAAEFAKQAAVRDVVAEVAQAYYELYFLDRANEVVARNRELLGDFAAVTEARYRVGTGVQPDVLKAQVEGTRLGDELLMLSERRAAALARLNALLDRSASTPIERPTLPERVERAVIPEPGLAVRFTAAALEPGTGDAGPIPSLADLQQLGERHNPTLRSHEARIEEQRALAELADKAALPDFDVMFGYGQRGGSDAGPSDREDMVTLMVSAPLPIFKGRKQGPLAAAEQADVAALEAEHRDLVNEIHAQVAALHASLARTRQRIALAREGILPQARAALESAVAGYPVATVDFLTLLDNQVTLFRHELDYVRLLADFGRDLTELERVVGTEVLR